MNKQRLKRLKMNASRPEMHRAMERLRRETADTIAIDYRISDSEYGSWKHYYYCHHDGARLTFSWSSPKQHCCPVCSAGWTGESYDGAWVSIAHETIGRGLVSLGLLFVLENNMFFAERVKSILMQYAKYYDGYEMHGGIPYNGPGKLYQQTLDESHWIIDLCLAYKCVESALTEVEKAYICNGLLLPCSSFLIEHKERQLHNHAVLITSAIAILGFVLDDEEVLRAGLEGEYGLKDQIARGVLADGLWYEGVFHYHFYAYHPILQYCLIAEGSKWDLRPHPALKRMFEFPLNFVLPDGTFHSLNDASSQANIGSYAPYYEIALGWYEDETYREYLQIAYRDYVSRDSRYALLFGEDLTPRSTGKLAAAIASNCSSQASGLTKLVNRQSWHLMIKHSPFGGEHDHMDRLGLSFSAGDVPLFVDPGTTAYAVPAHYAWFKHTYSHNTVCIDGRDQPPQDAKLRVFREESWGAWTDTEVDWSEDHYYVKDKIDLPTEMCSWDESAYRGVNIRRINAITDELLLDVVRVTAPCERQIDLLFHMSGELAHPAAWQPSNVRLGELDQNLFQDKMSMAAQQSAKLHWNMWKGRLAQASWCSLDVERYTTRTLDNPPTAFRQSLVQRVRTQGEIVFINAFSYDTSDRAGDLDMHVESLHEGALLISLVKAESIQQFIMDCNSNSSLKKRGEGKDE